jgi:pyruvate dehydrogenase E1 component beta subunit
MAVTTYLEAGKAAVASELRRDPRVWALGEDLGRGGVFGQYKGLIEEFGPDRIVDTPISEATIMGAAVGAALVGTRPIVEMRFSDFALCAVDELVNQAAKARFMFGGQAKVPLVVRRPTTPGCWRRRSAATTPSSTWSTRTCGRWKAAGWRSIRSRSARRRSSALGPTSRSSPGRRCGSRPKRPPRRWPRKESRWK